VQNFSAKIINFWLFQYVNRPGTLSCLQATAALLLSHLSLQTEPHLRTPTNVFIQTSTRPSLFLGPPINLISPSIHSFAANTMKDKGHCYQHINLCYFLCMKQLSHFKVSYELLLVYMHAYFHIESHQSLLDIRRPVLLLPWSSCLHFHRDWHHTL
jgi:hypothetical protein